MNDGKFRTPLKGAIGLGSAKQGLHHFVVQRITAVALLLLVPWFVWTALRLLHLDYAGAHALVAQPCNAILLIAFVVAVFWHAQLGLQVVLEDYIHHSLLALVLQTGVKFIAVLGALVSIFAVARIALAG